MADTGTDFLYFLKANYPEDYGKLASDSVSDSLVNTVFSKHREHFETWMKVPQWIRDKYNGKVPENILEVARTDPNLTDHEIKNIERNRPNENYSVNLDNLAFNISDYASIAAIAQQISQKGYSEQSARNLAYARQIRRKLLEDSSIKLTPKQKKQLWLETRQNDQKNIKKDWCENQPERMAIHLLKQLNCGKIDKNQALPQLDILFKKIAEQDHGEALAEQLKQPQSRFKHYKSDTRELLSELVKSHRIPLTPLQKAMQNEEFEFLGDRARPAQSRKQRLTKPIMRQTQKQMSLHMQKNSIEY